MEQKTSFTFKKAFIVYIGVLVTVVTILSYKIWTILEEFELAQSVYAAENFVSEFKKAPDIHIDAGYFEELVCFESTDAAKTALLNFISGEEVTCAPVRGRASGSSPEYNLMCKDEIIGALKLNMVSEVFKMVVLQIPEWEIEAFIPEIEFLMKSYTVVAPKNFKIMVNGIELTEEYVIYSSDNLLQYAVKGLVNEPDIEAIDMYGNIAAYSIDNLDINLDYETYEFALPGDFVLKDKQGNIVLGEQNQQVQNYILYSAEGFSNEFFEEHYEIYDVFGNEVDYSYKDRTIFAQYSEYEITIPDIYSISANGKMFDSKYCIASFEPENYQYNDIKEVNTYKVALADISKLEIKNKSGEPVKYIQSNKKIYPEQKDYSLTLPENFSFTVNGLEPVKESLVSIDKNPEYQYVAEYTDMPGISNYIFKGMYEAPKLAVTDNVGTVTEYVLDEAGLAIEGQIGIDAIPEELRGQIDVLEYAKIWSRYMSDDLGGELYGYYKVLPYLINGSYYQKVAYDFAKSGTFYYQTSHSLGEPPFSEEKVENVIVYSDNCFSCDISFNKHMILTRSKKKLVDYFYNRIYFVYSDDSNDGIDNPHWAIADIKYLEKENPDE